MSFRQYPDNIVAIICDGPPTVIDLGAPTPDANQQLEVIGMQLFKYGAHAAGVRLRANAYVGAELIGSSDWQTVSEIELKYQETNYFYGWIRLTFNPRINFNAAAPTRFALELDNYVYSASAWIGVVLDWPITMGYNDNPDQINEAPVALEFYGAV